MSFQGGAFEGGGGGGGASGDVTALETITAGSGGAADFDFTGIVATYASLRLLAKIRGEVAAVTETLSWEANGDSTAANYLRAGLFTGSAGPTAFTSASNAILSVPGSTADANSFGRLELEFPFYGDGVTNVEGVGRLSSFRDATNRFYSALGLRHTSVTALSELRLVLAGGDFAENSEATIWGLSA